jgi:hypothetical protein
VWYGFEPVVYLLSKSETEAWEDWDAREKWFCVYCGWKTLAIMGFCGCGAAVPREFGMGPGGFS